MRQAVVSTILGLAVCATSYLMNEPRIMFCLVFVIFITAVVGLDK